MCYMIDFTVHVSSYFLKSTLHCSCFIFVSFSPQSISFISPTTVQLVHIYLIWLDSHHMVIQPSLSVSLFSQSRLWKLATYECFQINFESWIGIHYLKLNSSGFTTRSLFISNRKHNMVSEETFQFVQQPTFIY